MHTLQFRDVGIVTAGCGAALPLPTWPLCSKQATHKACSCCCALDCAVVGCMCAATARELRVSVLVSVDACLSIVGQKVLQAMLRL